MTDPPEQAILELHRAAGLLGAYCAIERRLFELTGSIAAAADVPPEITVYLDSLSTEHAWHAELWADRLPVLSGVDAQALVVLPAPLEEVFGELGSGTPAEELSGLFRVVLPRLITSYARHADTATSVSEGPTLRALRLVLRDETEAWAAGEALVQGLLDTPEAAAAAAERVLSLETRLISAGLIPGLVPWPGRRA
jgi:hypothetical protein